MRETHTTKQNWCANGTKHSETSRTVVKLAGDDKFSLSNALDTIFAWTNPILHSSGTRTTMSGSAKKRSTVREYCEKVSKRRLRLLQPLIQDLGSLLNEVPVLDRTTITQDVLVTSLRLARTLFLFRRGDELLN